MYSTTKSFSNSKNHAHHLLSNDRISKEIVLTELVSSALNVPKNRIAIKHVTDAVKFSFYNFVDNTIYEGEYKISEDGIEVNFSPATKH